MAQTPTPSKVTDAEFNALVQRVADLEVDVVALQNDTEALDARVTALEGGTGTPPVDPPAELEPSPDGATATEPGTVLVSAALNALELIPGASGQNDWSIAVNGVRDPITHDVVQLYAKSGFIYQQAADWWRYNDSDGSWSYVQDPTQQPPDPGIPPDPGETPDPPTAGQFVALYTAGRGNSGTWNWGTGNDEELCQAIEAVESEINTQVQGYGFFSMYGSMNDWPGNYGWAINCMKASRIGHRLIPVCAVMPYWNGVDPEWYGWNDDRGLADAASGRWDEMYRNLARAVKENGADECIWRLGYENNFNFMPSAPNWSQESETLWARAFDQMSHCIRDESAKVGLNSIICFNPTCGRGSHSLEYMTPKPESFHVYAADLYNGTYPDDPADEQDDQKRREFWSTMFLGTDHIIEYARQYGKPLMLPETGGGDRPDGHGKHDSANFWNFEADDVCMKARNMGVPYWGPMLWDVSPGDGAFRFSNNTQPSCQSTIRDRIADGTLCGNMSETVAAGVAASITAPRFPDWDTITRDSQAFIAAHPDFIEQKRAAVHDLIDRARANKVGMRA